MEFALSQEHRLLQDSLRSVLGQAGDLASIRKIAAGDAGAAAALDQALEAFGLSALKVPEAQGGLGLGCLEACLVQEMIGAHVAPSRFLPDALAASVFADQPDLLGAIAAGEVRFALAISELFSRRGGAGADLSEGRLNGTSLMVHALPGATHILLADRDGGLHCIRSEQAQMRVMTTIDTTRTFHEIRLENAQAQLSRPCPPLVPALARLLLAADTLGAAQAMIEKAVSYAGERQQFGRVIGSFQAVKHMCAEMAAGLEPCRALVWYAAHALDTRSPEAPVLACHAKAHVSEIGTFIARTATEVHGGMGFTDLLGLHYWFKRIGFNRQLLGGPQAVRADAARLRGYGR